MSGSQNKAAPQNNGGSPVKIEMRRVDADEAGMRLDRWFKENFPELGFGRLQKLLRTKQVRVDGKRAESSTRLEKGQEVRIPPLGVELAADDRKNARPRPRKLVDSDREAIEQMMLFEDAHVMVLNKPAGLAVQGGSGLTRHVDGMLDAFTNQKGDKPRLVHRLDRETSGILLVAKTRRAAQELTKAFRHRNTRKIYWAMVAGVPKPRQGRISTYLARDEGEERMRVARHGDDEAQHAVSLYNVVEQSGQKLSWVSLKPVTGRTHQLRAHAAHIGCPIVGDPKYFNIKNWELPGGIQNKLHLLARRIMIPHPSGNGVIDVSAPLPSHMQQTWNLLGMDVKDYDPDINEPE
ncbi:Ribosomal large subunit pseudouridine synthase C [Pseudovibrio sp. W64]|uniref:RluA family pseudouridine synthase n=1 Tax=unclassified Pseudovibrio TaxID=2627060 RepID=UPI0007AED738|nr:MULTISPECIES: RluA family pseudouridine synthase [unclassified Pseudovibrio]KZK78925.1 Ribosomal large subunit pseudouridine synthase C [Pseudovibrio sp. Ad46]KZK79433.1 Ribosomal large subunit pseudouridine synthase C [Pseudovibrio sp. W64]KZK93306.1 Ribosomal large subunit pseudouridine synthase C [Pseudovibrio sp. Ad5]KZL05916.1 Ribosomal large subunit pseudouridine synthase C [Pseudovibrio sp. Ad26]KZL23894.1 Ribosomal large subunit pseudouridine synthase C [Pseudovibrio sp. WM33]